ncbi:response regulator [bacterium]|nr:response regulator [bacterium]MBU1921305.1 response regulator [bacterium]
MKSILIVDDEPEVRAYLKEILKDQGYRIILAANGSEAVCIQNTHCCDLIIIDIFMPVAEGLSTIVKIRQNSPDTRIIAISGGGILGIGHYLDHALIYGADVAMEKPIRGSELVSQVQQLMEQDFSLASSFFV